MSEANKYVIGPWRCQRRSNLTPNLGIYREDGSLVAPVDVSGKSLKELDGPRRKQEGLMMAAAPSLAYSLDAALPLLRELCDPSNINHASIIEMCEQALFRAKGHA